MDFNVPVLYDIQQTRSPDGQSNESNMLFQHHHHLHNTPDQKPLISGKILHQPLEYFYDITLKLNVTSSFILRGTVKTA